MLYVLVKLSVSAGLIVIISELAKRGGWLGGLLASLPIVSLLAIVWLYVDTRDVQKVASLSSSIFWLVLPSLSFFIALSLLLRARWGFWPSIVVALAIMFVCYLVMMAIIQKFGIEV